MTVYTGRTFQTCALRVWGLWVSMRDFQRATVRYNRDTDFFADGGTFLLSSIGGEFGGTQEDQNRVQFRV